MSSKDKAELFAKLFSINSTLDDSGHPFPDFPDRTNTYLDNFDISSKKVAAVIARLAPKATSPDGIPDVVLQKCSPELSPVLSKLYAKCVSESCFSSCWKFPSVIPVFKKVNLKKRSDPLNYRPIGLLPIISKVFESLINRSLVNHLDSNNLFSDFQYGFRSGRSTADVLTVTSECVYHALDACGETRAIALDISKTFDKVWHAGLLHKLKSYGISGPFLEIINSFLSYRKMRVVLDGQTSNSYSINAAVHPGLSFFLSL